MHSGLINGSIWHFTPKCAKDYKGDYHELLNAENYLNWFEYSLHLNIHEPELIVLQHAVLRKTKPLNTQKPFRMRKQAILHELNRYDISYAPKITAFETKILLIDWKNEHIQAQIITLAENCGHNVIFIPPHHSDVQPIEMV